MSSNKVKLTDLVASTFRGPVHTDTPLVLTEDIGEYVFHPIPMKAAAGQDASDAVDDMAVAQEARTRAKAFFTLVRTAINTAKSRSSPRRDLDEGIKQLIDSHPKVSSSCLYLAEWLRSLLRRKTESKLIELSSVERYFNSLSPCFELVGYQFELKSADTDEVTDFYAAIMDARLSKDKDDKRPTENAASAETCADLQRASDQVYVTWQLALYGLQDFHRLLRDKLAFEEPDWTEVGRGEKTLSISPGYLLEKEYHHALSILAPDVQKCSRVELARAFILLGCYRFGLRGRECTGLLRGDWVEPTESSTVLLVQPNRYRRLKTINARRQVPLLFKLSQSETCIIDRFFALWKGESLKDSEIPLFWDRAKGKLLNERQLRWEVSQVLKEVTKNARISLHHARHTFANNAGMLLLDLPSDLWPHANQVPCDENEFARAQENARTLLLCTRVTSRRTLWALARLLGHAHPHTAVKSYLHFLPSYTDALVWPNNDLRPATTHEASKDALVLEECAQLCENYMAPSTWTPVSSEHQRLSISKALRFMYLYQSGASVEDAAVSTEIDEAEARKLTSLLDAIDPILTPREPKVRSRFEKGPSTLLSHIDAHRWKSLIAIAEKADTRIRGTKVFWTVPEVGDILGRNRQILLYNEEHFKRFAQCVERLQYDAATYQLISDGKPHPTHSDWAVALGLNSVQESEIVPIKKHKTGKGRKRISPRTMRRRVQVDTLAADHLLHRAKRVAAIAVVGTTFRSNYEFVLISLLGMFLPA